MSYPKPAASRPGISVSYSSADLPSLESPYLVCGFPGSGYVGKLAVDHLISELKAELLADIYSTSFPPQVMIRTDGTADLMKNSIYWWKGEGASILMLTGDSQPANPESEYSLAEEILDIASRFNVRHIYTLAAYITGTFVDKPRVFGTATDIETVRKFSEKNISAMDGGSITGMNGVIIGVAKLREMKGTCLLGETSGYVVDAKASRQVLETLLSITGVKVSMTDLEKKAKDTEMLIQTIEQQMMAGRGRGMPEGVQQPSPPKGNTGYIS